MKLSAAVATFIFLVVPSTAFHAVPVILGSHKMVKGLRLSKPWYDYHSGDEVTNLAKKLITECSSDEYIIVDQPGLSYDDIRISEKENWPFLRKYLTMSSSVFGVPWCEDALDLDHLEKYIIKTCSAETINVVNEDDGEVGDYFDTRTRVIRIQLGELPPRQTHLAERMEKIRRNDDLVRKIIRKLPSPNYTLIVTSSTLQENHFVPENIIESSPESFQIFSDIIHDPSREFDYERNDRYRDVSPDFPAPRHTNDRYKRNKKKDEIHFFDYELWKKNEQLIMTIVMMVFGLVFLKFTSFIKYVWTSTGSRNNSGSIISSSGISSGGSSESNKKND